MTKAPQIDVTETWNQIYLTTIQDQVNDHQFHSTYIP